jgi:dienelactone hydrolase
VKKYLTHSIFFFFFSLTVTGHTQQTVQKLITETQYLLYLPEAYHSDTAKKWPLLLFLHGSGESGYDINKVKTHGPPKLIEQGKAFPFIVVSPQSDVPRGWDVDQLYKLLQQVKKNYRVDAARVYCTGLSMGGFGTWKMAMKYPDEFAAIAPICGGGDTTDAWKIRNLPVWCFHGALDDVVPVSGSTNMVKATGRWNPNVRLTIYPDKNHNSWDTTYNTNDSLYNWLLSHRKFTYKEAPVNTTLLKKYEGWFAGPDGDTVHMVVQNKGLKAVNGKDTVPLLTASENLFFLRPDRNMDIRFVSENNSVSSFLFLGDRKLLYRRIKKK